MTVKKGMAIVEIETGKLLKVEGEVGKGVSTQFDFLATYVSSSRRVAKTNRGFKLSDEGKVWEKL